MDSTSREIEAATRRKYSGAVYQPETISKSVVHNPSDYSARMLALKFELIRQYCLGDPLLDVCCSTGVHLEALSGGRRLAAGVDFSFPFLAHARQRRGGAMVLVCANARALPFRSASIGSAYALSSLYHIPDAGEVIAEISRVLRPGGRCVLDMGNSTSLNTIVCRAYPELAEPCHMPVETMRRMILGAGLRVLVHRRFQILPMWGDRPARLGWLLSPRLARVMTTMVAGKMLDEWISSLPGLRQFAFRHVLVCEKPIAGGNTRG